MNEYNKAATKVAYHGVHMLQMHGVMEYTCYKSMEWLNAVLCVLICQYLQI
jgi:hypothetical protein